MKSLLVFVAFAAALIANSQNAPVATPPAAKELISKAQKSAADSKRNVFVSFHASWCGWCHKMESVFKQDEIRVIMDRHFVIVNLDVLENDGKKALENPGSLEVLKAAGGAEQGIPYFYISDPKGKVLINSIMPADGAKKASNVGCPYEPAEIAFFVKMLKKGAPRITDAELALVKIAFEQLKKKDGTS